MRELMRRFKQTENRVRGGIVEERAITLLRNVVDTLQKEAFRETNFCRRVDLIRAICSIVEAIEWIENDRREQ